MSQIAPSKPASPQYVGRLRPPMVHDHKVFGSMRTFQRNPLATLMGFAQHGDVIGYRVGWMMRYLLRNPDHIEQVLQKNYKNYSKGALDYKVLGWMVGNGLLTSDGAFWLRQRRLAQPAFHRRRIAALGTLMTNATEAMLERWREPIAQGRTFDVSQSMMELTLRIVSEALFGSDVSAHSRTIAQAFDVLNEQIVTRFRSLWLIPPVLPTPRDRAFRAALQTLNQAVYEIIAERRRHNEDRGDLLSMLMLTRDEETGETMNDRQLRDEVMTLMLAGHETTATTLTWTWYLLSEHPDVARRLREELAAVLGGRTPTMSDVPNLVYTRMVIEESLRLYPPAWVTVRKVDNDDIIGGYHIPAGSTVVVSAYVLHRNPTFWPDPERFDPERFTPERVAERPRFAYIPFSAGPRQCIGNTFALVEAQLILATIAQRYHLDVAPGHRVAPEPLITLRPKGGMPVIGRTV